MTMPAAILPVRIAIGDDAIDGDLAVPASPLGLVVFAHGSGSSRFSSRNRAVAGVLQQAGYATLLLDLLTADEAEADERAGRHRFDVERLGARVLGAMDWAAGHRRLAALGVACFGASTGAAAALIAAAARPHRVHAVVSRGGRPDLAGDALPAVTAPTLLIVGGADAGVLDLNREALQRMRAAARLEIVPGATHLFEEPGALERVAALAVDWCRRYVERGASTAAARAAEA
jgi:dienelactone hydrolase